MRSSCVLALIAGLLLGLVGCSGKPDGDAAKRDDPPGAATPKERGATATQATPSPTSDVPKETTGQHALDVEYVLPDFCIAVAVYPQRIAKAPMLASLPQDKLLENTIKKAKLDPRKIEQLLVLFTPEALTGLMGNETPAAVIRFSEPFDVKKYLGEPKTDVQETTIAGKPCYTASSPGGPTVAVYQPDAKTAVAAAPAVLEKMLTAGGKGPLAERLRGIGAPGDLTVLVVLDPLLPMLDQFAAKAKRDPTTPPPIVAVLGIVTEDLAAAAVTADLSGDTLLKIELDGKDAAATDRLENLVKQNVEMAKQMLAQARKELSAQMPPALAAPIFGLAKSFLNGIDVTKTAQRVTAAAKKPEGVDEAIKALTPMLLAGMDAAREAGERARRTSSLRQIGLALHSYCQANRTFPTAAICDSQGKPLLSWRVAILPYVEGAALHQQFHLDEPWDSEHNKTLIERMPEVYRNPGRPKDGTTSFLAVVGDDTAIGPLGAKAGVKIADIVDGLSQTIIVVEAGPDKAVPWTKPADAPFDKDNPASALGEIGGGFLALFCDGSVQFCKKGLDAEVLGKLLNRHDQTPLDPSKR